jgi:DNA-binding transcriptional regulator YiaG
MPMSSRRRSGTVDNGMASADADQAIHLRDSVSLTEQDLAIATGGRQATVVAWLEGIAAPEGAHADRLIELAVLVQRLA